MIESARMRAAFLAAAALLGRINVTLFAGGVVMRAGSCCRDRKRLVRSHRKLRVTGSAGSPRAAKSYVRIQGLMRFR